MAMAKEELFKAISQFLFTYQLDKAGLLVKYKPLRELRITGTRIIHFEQKNNYEQWIRQQLLDAGFDLQKGWVVIEEPSNDDVICQ
jgi:hypothetical protein